MFVPSVNGVVAGRYELIEEIGRGGMGVVWRARQANLSIDCAVKFIHPTHEHDPELRQRFVREARAAASLQSPNSVQILDVDEWQGSLFIAMELLSGESLETRLEREGKLSPELTLQILEQVARGLNKAHAARLVHRDLKPDNIFLVEDDPLLVKILDFGIAKRLDASSGPRTASGALVGTPGYMSPEQAHGGKSVDFRADLWSLAVVAFRCLTGKQAFEGEGLGEVLLAIMQGPLPSPCQVEPSLPAGVDEWWLRALQREPARRPESASALVSGLRAALLSSTEAPRVLTAARVRADGVAPPQHVTLQPFSASQSRSSRPLMRYSAAAAGVIALIALALVSWLRARVDAGSEKHTSAPTALAAPPAELQSGAEARHPPLGGAAAAAPSAEPVVALLSVAPPPVAVEPPAADAAKAQPRAETHGTSDPRVQPVPISLAKRRPAPALPATRPSNPLEAATPQPPVAPPASPAPAPRSQPPADDPRLGF